AKRGTCLAVLEFSMKKISVLLAAIVGLCVSSSAEKPKESKSKQNAPAAKTAVDSTAHGSGVPSVDTKTYVIGAEDILLMKIWNEPNLSGTYVVRPDGKISMPLIGEVQAANLTPEKLGASIAESLSKFINHPDVSVAVHQVNSKKYFIMGEVQK